MFKQHGYPFLRWAKDGPPHSSAEIFLAFTLEKFGRPTYQKPSGIQAFLGDLG